MLHIAPLKEINKKNAVSMHIIIKPTVNNILEAQQLVDVTARDNDENQQISL